MGEPLSSHRPGASSASLPKICRATVLVKATISAVRIVRKGRPRVPRHEGTPSLVVDGPECIVIYAMLAAKWWRDGTPSLGAGGPERRMIIDAATAKAAAPNPPEGSAPARRGRSSRLTSPAGRRRAAAQPQPARAPPSRGPRPRQLRSGGGRPIRGRCQPRRRPGGRQPADGSETPARKEWLQATLESQTASGTPGELHSTSARQPTRRRRPARRR